MGSRITDAPPWTPFIPRLPLDPDASALSPTPVAVKLFDAEGAGPGPAAAAEVAAMRRVAEAGCDNVVELLGTSRWRGRHAALGATAGSY